MSTTKTAASKIGPHGWYVKALPNGTFTYHEVGRPGYEPGTPNYARTIHNPAETTWLDRSRATALRLAQKYHRAAYVPGFDYHFAQQPGPWRPMGAEMAALYPRPEVKAFYGDRIINVPLTGIYADWDAFPCWRAELEPWERIGMRVPKGGPREFVWVLRAVHARLVADVLWPTAFASEAIAREVIDEIAAAASGLRVAS
jgi:hypothetical protein